MESETHYCVDMQPVERIGEPHFRQSTPSIFPPLESVVRRTVNTATAAYYLDRSPQTLRGWSCLDNGPIRPLRVNGRLAWPVAELRRVLKVAP